MKKWEYKYVNKSKYVRDYYKYREFLIEELNEYGKEGWELCGDIDEVRQGSDYYYSYTLKREVEATTNNSQSISKEEKPYKTQTWLNPIDSPSTGSIVCYDGEFKTDEGKLEPWSFLEIADCHQKVRLHSYRGDTDPDAFLKKLKFIYSDLGKFINYLENKNDGTDKNLDS